MACAGNLNVNLVSQIWTSGAIIPVHFFVALYRWRKEPPERNKTADNLPDVIAPEPALAPASISLPEIKPASSQVHSWIAGVAVSG